jgi:hypothetical protein
MFAGAKHSRVKQRKSVNTVKSAPFISSPAAGHGLFSLSSSFLSEQTLLSWGQPRFLVEVSFRSGQLSLTSGATWAGDGVPGLSVLWDQLMHSRV